MQKKPTIIYFNIFTKRALFLHAVDYLNTNKTILNPFKMLIYLLCPSLFCLNKSTLVIICHNRMNFQMNTMIDQRMTKKNKLVSL